MSSFKRAIDPVNLAVTLDTAKNHLKVEDAITEDDTLITTLINAAIDKVEAAGVALITQTWDLVMDQWPGDEIWIPRAPLQSVAGIYYTPDGGAEAELDAANYFVDTISEPGRVVLQRSGSWPSTTLQRANGIRVRFVAGFGDDPADVPSRYTQAILLMVGHWYENREQVVVTGAVPKEIPLGAQMLIRLDGTGTKGRELD